MHDAIEERMQAYNQEILRKLAEKEREDCRGRNAPKLKNPNKATLMKGRGDEPMRQAFGSPMKQVMVKTPRPFRLLSKPTGATSL